MRAKAYIIAPALLAGIFVVADRVRPQSAITTRPVRSSPTTRPVTHAVNPHWSVTGCMYCHQGAVDQIKPIPRAEIDALCLKCHNGRQAAQEKHPVGRAFSGTQIIRPADWPAPGDKLGCITCHDISQGCHQNAQRPLDNPEFLRGPHSQNLSTFCGTCHVNDEQHQRYNPHLMLDADRTHKEQACQYCHQTDFAEHDLVNRTRKPVLKKDEITLCLGCHAQHIDWFDPGHIGARVTPEIRAYMLAVEKKPFSENAEPTYLPLAAGNTITCSTCHNPHQQGVFPSDSVLSLGAFTGDQHQAQLPLRRLGKEVCLGCHGK